MHRIVYHRCFVIYFFPISRYQERFITEENVLRVAHKYAKIVERLTWHGHYTRKTINPTARRDGEDSVLAVRIAEV
jgi:hypothetical protein